MIISRKYICKLCGAQFTIEADEERFARLDASKHIQDVFPELDIDSREIMISGVCGKCFDEMFADEDDEEYSEDKLSS